MSPMGPMKPSSIQSPSFNLCAPFSNPVGVGVVGFVVMDPVVVVADIVVLVLFVVVGGVTSCGYWSGRLSSGSRRQH